MLVMRVNPLHPPVLFLKAMFEECNSQSLDASFETREKTRVIAQGSLLNSLSQDQGINWRIGVDLHGGDGKMIGVGTGTRQPV
jgi:hypothetical protein